MTALIIKLTGRESVDDLVTVTIKLKKEKKKKKRRDGVWGLVTLVMCLALSSLARIF